jgi:hypothetical protein
MINTILATKERLQLMTRLVELLRVFALAPQFSRETSFFKKYLAKQILFCSHYKNG